MNLYGWRRLLVMGSGAYLACCAGLFLIQRRMLYFPQRLAEERADLAFAACGLVRWPEAAGVAYRGLAKASDAVTAPAQGTVLIFHGNAGSACDRAEYCEPLGALGWRAVIAEYPGYGARAGAPSEAALREDGRATARLVRQRFSGRLVILGESLGAGVAAAVAADPEVRADAVLLATPWDRLASVAAHHYPWLPTRALLRDRYDSAAYLRGYAGPVTVLLAERDETIPEASTLALYAALPQKDKRLVRIPQSTHNEWFWMLGEERWREVLSCQTIGKGNG